MKTTNQRLGLFGMVSAPFLWIQTKHFVEAGMHNTSLDGVYDLLYMLGWGCSIVALLHARATGDTLGNQAVLYAQLGCLLMACIWNVWVIVAPNSEGVVFRFFDMFWPISNVFMLVTGYAVLKARRLPGWARYVPLLVGCWFPCTMLAGMQFGQSVLTYYVMNGYSLVAWFCLGLVAFNSPAPAQAHTRLAAA